MSIWVDFFFSYLYRYAVNLLMMFVNKQSIPHTEVDISLITTELEFQNLAIGRNLPTLYRHKVDGHLTQIISKTD